MEFFFNTAIEPISLQSVAVCVSLISVLVNGSVNPLPWKSLHATIEDLMDVIFLSGSCLIICRSVYPPIVARQQLDKRVLAATTNCWKRFLCGSCRNEGK
jgi:hypothetical protein